jgi:hypothetical protein
VRRLRRPAREGTLRNGRFAMRLEIPTALAVVLISALAAAGDTPARGGRRRVVEFRSYNLKPGSRDAFHRLATRAATMLRRYDIDVVALGPSTHDDTSYFLLRAFADREDRTRKEEAFYESDEWKHDLREPVLALIEAYTTVVLELDDSVVEGLRRRGD